MNEIVQRMDLSSWKGWKHSLGVAVEFAEELGISQDTISNFAAQFGNYLTNNVPADLAENRAIKELWEVASPEEQKIIANCMVKLAKKNL